MNEADALLVIGASFANHTGIYAGHPIVHVDRDPLQLGRTTSVAVPLLADAAVAARALQAALPASERRRSRPGRRRGGALRALGRREAQPRAPTTAATASAVPQCSRRSAEHAPDDAVIAVDVGNHAYSFGRYHESKRGQQVLMSGLLGSIGFGYPAAIGAWAATGGERPVFAVTGDGGYAQYMAELTTAVRHGMRIVHVLLNNGQLGKISKEQRAGMWDVWQTRLHNPDFSKWAELCGALGIRVTSADGLDDAFTAALAHDGPALIEVMTDPELDLAMAEISFDNLLVVVAIAFAAPLLLGLAPGLRLPAVVLEIVAGIVVGPSGLGWVEIDEPVSVLAILGLAMLLFLSGPRGRPRATARAVAARGAARLRDLVRDRAVRRPRARRRRPRGRPRVRGDRAVGDFARRRHPGAQGLGLARSDFGQLVIAAASIADVATIVLLSLLFSREATSTGATLALLGAMAVVALVIGGFVLLGERSMRLSGTLLRLQDTTAQIRVRGAFLLVVGFAALAGALGLEVILGAFVAGLLLGAVDPDHAMTHPIFRAKLEAVGFGVLVPVFFVTSGLRFDLGALTQDTSTIALVPLLLGALLLVRGTPVLARAQAPGGRAPRRRGRAAAGDIAAVHRRRDDDRPGDRRAVGEPGRRARRRRARVGADLPARRAVAAAAGY